MLALKLAELALAHEDGDRPLLLLDDVGSELDPQRTDALFERLSEVTGQCVITTTSPAFVRVPPHREHRYVAVERGQLTSTAAGA